MNYESLPSVQYKHNAVPAGMSGDNQRWHQAFQSLQHKLKSYVASRFPSKTSHTAYNSRFLVCHSSDKSLVTMVTLPRQRQLPGYKYYQVYSIPILGQSVLMTGPSCYCCRLSKAAEAYVGPSVILLRQPQSHTLSGNGTVRSRTAGSSSGDLWVECH